MDTRTAVSRRTLLKQAAVAGATGVVASAGLGSAALAGPVVPHPGRVAAFQGGLSGTITVSYPDELGKKPPFVDKAAKAVEAANPQATVKIDLQKIPEDQFYTKLLLALNSGSGPDVFHVSGGDIGELADAGYIMPLDDFLNAWPDWKYYPDSVRSGVTYKGKVWALPYGLDTRFLYFRRDIFQTSGLATDWTPANVAGILDAAQTIQSKDTTVIPYVLYAGQAGSSGTTTQGFMPLVYAYGGTPYDTDSSKWVGASTALNKAFAFYEQAFIKDKLVPKEVLTTTKPWTAMRQKLGDGGLALLYEGGWVYGGWYSADQAGTQKNVGYLLFPTENGGPSFTIGGPGTCWYINAKSKNKDLAWAFIAAFNNKDTVAQLNIEDPHPVARTDSAEVPAFAANKFLVDSTNSLKEAKFLPPDPNSNKVDTVTQKVTGLVADGELSAADGAKRYLSDLKQAIGANNVVEQS